MSKKTQKKEVPNEDKEETKPEETKAEDRQRKKVKKLIRVKKVKHTKENNEDNEPQKETKEKSSSKDKESRAESDKKEEKSKSKEKSSKKVSKKAESKKAAPKAKKEANNSGIYRKYIAEAIASFETDEKQFVSEKKIHDYIFQYAEEIKKPQLIKRHLKTTFDSLVEEKLLIRKRSSLRFSSEGRRKICPDKIPKRKEVRALHEEEDPQGRVVKESRSVFITKSGRVSMKLY